MGRMCHRGQVCGKEGKNVKLSLPECDTEIKRQECGSGGRYVRLSGKQCGSEGRYVILSGQECGSEVEYVRLSGQGCGNEGRYVS